MRLTPEASDAEVKAQYRKLVRDNHPDRLMANGVPVEFIELANRKLAAINDAYKTIARERGPLMDKPDTALVGAVCPSANFEPRRRGAQPSILLLHYTGVASAAKAIDWLSRSESKVSAHYVIDDAGRITQLVAEAMRAWHAGLAAWAGETDINSASIGIEIHNPGHELGYPDFPEPQLAAVEALCRDIIARHAIRPERVLAHSDVAPTRKKDPGEKFPWARLARAGIGHWVTPEPSPGPIRALPAMRRARWWRMCRPCWRDTATASRRPAVSIPRPSSWSPRSNVTFGPNASTGASTNRPSPRWSG